MSRALKKIYKTEQAIQNWNRPTDLPITQPPQNPIAVEGENGDGTIDVTTCDAPRRRSLAYSILKMNLVGIAFNVVLAATALSILTQDQAALGTWVENQGLRWGRDVAMTAQNFQGAVYVALIMIAMLVNVGVVFHLIHDAALHYRFRAWAVRLIARVIISLPIVGGERVKSWSSVMLDRSRVDRWIGFVLLMFVAIPLFVAGSVLPWVWVLSVLGNPLVATTVTVIFLSIVLVPTTLELFRIALHIRNADAND